MPQDAVTAAGGFDLNRLQNIHNIRPKPGRIRSRSDPNPRYDLLSRTGYQRDTLNSARRFSLAAISRASDSLSTRPLKTIP